MEKWNSVNERMENDVKTLCISICIGLGILYLAINIAEFVLLK